MYYCTFSDSISSSIVFATYNLRFNLATTPAQKDPFHRASSTLSTWKNSCLPECKSTQAGSIQRVPLKTFQQAKFRAKMARPMYLSTKVLGLKRGMKASYPGFETRLCQWIIVPVKSSILQFWCLRKSREKAQTRFILTLEDDDDERYEQGEVRAVRLQVAHVRLHLRGDALGFQRALEGDVRH
jgi:hypothetical protein